MNDSVPYTEFTLTWKTSDTHIQVNEIKSVYATSSGSISLCINSEVCFNLTKHFQVLCGRVHW